MYHVKKSQNNFTALILNIRFQELAGSGSVLITHTGWADCMSTSVRLAPLEGAEPSPGRLPRCVPVSHSGLAAPLRSLPPNPSGISDSSGIFKSTYFLIITCHFLFSDNWHYLFFREHWHFWPNFKPYGIGVFLCDGCGPRAEQLPEICMTVGNPTRTYHSEHGCMAPRKVGKGVDPQRFYHGKRRFSFLFIVSSWHDECWLNPLWWSFHTIHKSNHHAVYLKQWCMSIISQ